MKGDNILWPAVIILPTQDDWAAQKLALKHLFIRALIARLQRSLLHPIVNSTTAMSKVSRTSLVICLVILLAVRQKMVGCFCVYNIWGWYILVLTLSVSYHSFAYPGQCPIIRSWLCSSTICCWLGVLRKTDLRRILYRQLNDKFPFVWHCCHQYRYCWRLCNRMPNRQWIL